MSEQIVPETITKTAKRLHNTPNSRGDAAVYELDPPFVETEYDYDTSEYKPTGNLLRYVVVSAVDLPNITHVIPDYRTSETMIFPSDGKGVRDFGELAMVPYKSHEDALRELGYEVTR